MQTEEDNFIRFDVTNLVLKKFIGDKVLGDAKSPIEILSIDYSNGIRFNSKLFINEEDIKKFEEIEVQSLLNRLQWSNSHYNEDFKAELTNTGRNFIATAIINSGSPTFFTNANSYLGVGDSNTAFSAAQTDLQAASNKIRVAMDATYPTIATNLLTFRSTFSTSQANFAWQEWASFNASSSGTMLQRKVESLGTKTSAQSWQLTSSITVVAA